MQKEKEIVEGLGTFSFLILERIPVISLLF